MKIRFYFLLFTYIFLFPAFNINASTFSLKELIDQKKISCKAISNGGLTLKLTIRNLTKDTILGAVNPGDYFYSADEKAQDILANSIIPFTVSPYDTSVVVFKGNCTEKRNYYSYKGTIFNYSTTENIPLKDLAFTCSTNENKYSPYRQGWIWNLADKVNPLFLENEFSSKDPIYKCFSKYTKIARTSQSTKVKNITRTVQSSYIFSSRINITYNLQEDKSLSLVCTDINGKILEEYYKNKIIKKGYYSVTIGYNEMVPDSNYKIIFKLIDDKGVIVYKKNVRNNLLEDKPNVYQLNTILEYEIKTPIKKATMKLFDENNNLIQVLLKEKDMASGLRKMPFSFLHMSGLNSILKVKIFNEKGECLMAFPISTQGSLNKK